MKVEVCDAAAPWKFPVLRSQSLLPIHSYNRSTQRLRLGWKNESRRRHPSLRKSRLAVTGLAKCQIADQ
jgi:hypothetical protein